MAERNRVVIVEDDRRLRRELAALVDEAEGFRCHGCYADAEAALAGIPGDPPDLVLMDINLPGASGIDAVRGLKAVLPSLPVVMLTVYDDSEALFRALMAGASGYVLKRTPRARLLELMKECGNGGAPMSRSIARKVVEFFHRVREAPAPPPAELAVLTAREHEILASLAKGYSYKEIAADLRIGGDTVRKHMGRIYEKLQVHSRTEAILKFLGR
jgi:DNA-binding NarL/FixJ family response regulator